ncbi:hypothetical protein [Pantoea agglomerans]|uniref:hypothetical protein n=1 Tax=Enterobacter agglomerans TaxID=549 RepID=UPI003209B8A7
MKISNKLTTYFTFLLLFSSLAKANDEKWIFVPKSDSVDFKIICTDGEKTIWGIYERGGTSDYQVARNIYIRRTNDGRTILSFMRGFISADKKTTYIPAVNVNCEASEK